jgi:hypothetical protein
VFIVGRLSGVNASISVKSEIPSNNRGQPESVKLLPDSAFISF